MPSCFTTSLFMVLQLRGVNTMTKSIYIISDKTFRNERYGCIINGSLHVSPVLYDRIQSKGADVSHAFVSHIKMIDVDEMVFIDNLKDVIIFAGQQVKVFDNGFYLGDATISCYPYSMKFEFAEVCMHYP